MHSCFLRNNIGLYYSSLQVLYPTTTSMCVNSSHVKMVVYVRTTMEVSAAFAPNKAKMGSCMGERPAQLHFLGVMTTNARIEEYARPYLSMISTLINASALPASQALNARLLPSSHLSPEATCS